MTNYVICINEKCPVFMLEGDDEYLIQQYFQTFVDTAFSHGLSETFTLNEIVSDKENEIEAKVIQNIAMSPKLAEIVDAYLELPEPFNPEWN